MIEALWMVQIVLFTLGGLMLTFGLLLAIADYWSRSDSPHFNERPQGHKED